MIRRITVMVGVCIVGLVAWLFLKNAGENQTPVESVQAPIKRSETTTADIQRKLRPLIGRWIRPDGGYVLEIQNVKNDGQLALSYFNPKPINVSEARATWVESSVRVFVELQDIGYPGATYTLVHDPAKDVLLGLYYQPTAGQNFEVVFVRMQ